MATQATPTAMMRGQSMSMSAYNTYMTIICIERGVYSAKYHGLEVLGGSFIDCIERMLIKMTVRGVIPSKY